MFGAVVWLIVVGSIISLVLSQKAAKFTKLNEEWMKAAGKLGLSFRKAAGLFNTPRIEGEIGDFLLSVHVDLDRKGNRIEPRSFYKILLPKPCSLEFDGRTKELVEKFRKMYPKLIITGEEIVCAFEGIEDDESSIRAKINHLMRLAKGISGQASDGDGSDDTREEIPLAAATESPRPELVPKREAPFSHYESQVPPEPEISSHHYKSPVPPLKFEMEGKVRMEDKTPPPVSQKVAAAPIPAVPEPASPEDALAAGTLSKTLFGPAFPGQKEREAFDAVKGSRVVWSGVLKSAHEFGSDFDFGAGPATKAIFEICELENSSRIKFKIKAVVRLPQEAAAELKSKEGGLFKFGGSLLKFEPFAKELLLSEGGLIP